MRWVGADFRARVLWYFPIIMTSSRVSLYGISWGLCKYKAEVMRRLRRFVQGHVFVDCGLICGRISILIGPLESSENCPSD